MTKNEKEQIEKRIYKLISEFNSHSEHIKMKQNTYITFELYMKLNDKFVSDMYNTGNAFIYPSQACYEYIDLLCKKHDIKLSWNNTRTIAWDINS